MLEDSHVIAYKNTLNSIHTPNQYPGVNIHRRCQNYYPYTHSEGKKKEKEKRDKENLELEK